MHDISVPLDHQKICPSYGTPPGGNPPPNDAPPAENTTPPSPPPQDTPQPDGSPGSPPAQYPPKPWGKPAASPPAQQPPQPWSQPSNAQPPANNYAQGYPAAAGYVPVAPGPVIIDSELHYGGKSSHVESSGGNAGHDGEAVAEDREDDASAS